MISVIVPVYNVEPYLRKCLNSIINQTYRDLEILIIDDGSTDGSGAICDEYKKDERVKVLHTNNRGLSCARNAGLDIAKGNWIGFVDSDDWIESDMFEALLKRVEETGADIVECGFFMDYQDESIMQIANQEVVCGTETVEALLKGQISTLVWNKIYRASLFNNIRFPVGRLFEDISTMHKVISHAIIAGVSNNSYHWIQRESSISQSHDLKNLIDYWLAYKERFEWLYYRVSEEAKQILLKDCAYAIARTWVWYWNGEKDSEFVKELTSFTLNHYPIIGQKNWPVVLRISIFLARFNNAFSLASAYTANQLYRVMKPKYYK